MFRKLLALGVLAGALMVSTAAHAQACVVAAATDPVKVTLNWHAPTVAENGDALAAADLPLTFNIYMGTSAGGESPAPVAIGSAALPTSITAGLVAGNTYYFRLAAVSARGTIGAFTNEVCKTFPKPVPAAAPGSFPVRISALLPSGALWERGRPAYTRALAW